MNLTDRYIARLFIKSFLMALLTLTIIFVLAQFFNSFQEELSPQHALILNLYSIPQNILRLAPVGALVGSLVTLSSLNRTSELTAIWASGYSTGRIAVLISFLGLVIGVLSFLGKNYIVPHLEKERLYYYYVEVKNRPDYSTEIRKDRIWYRSKNLIYTIETFDEANKTVYGLSLFHISNMDVDFRLIQQIKARKAIYNPDIKKWHMQDGTLTIFDSLKGYPLTKKFVSRYSDIAETPEDFEKERKAEMMTLAELNYQISKNQAAGLGVTKFKTKFHSRIALGLAPLLMALIAIPFSFGNRRSQSLGKDIVIAFFMVVFYWLFHSMGLHMGDEGRIAPFLGAWISNFVFLIFGVILVYKKKIPT